MPAVKPTADKNRADKKNSPFLNVFMLYFLTTLNQGRFNVERTAEKELDVRMKIDIFKVIIINHKYKLYIKPFQLHDSMVYNNKKWKLQWEVDTLSIRINPLSLNSHQIFYFIVLFCNLSPILLLEKINCFSWTFCSHLLHSP